MDQLAQNIAEVAQTLRQITAQARQRGADRFFTSFSGQRPSIKAMQQKVWINSHWPIAWPRWPAGFRAKLTALWRKVIRRALQWYIDPMVQQQNEFNQATLNAMRLVSQELLALRLSISDSGSRQAQLDRLTSQVEALEHMLAEETPEKHQRDRK
jgi:hypothetical protein